jgi:precorrin-6B methylase 2
MLDDRRRTEAFITAINHAVQPGDIVVDIGTGTGVLAIAAVRAGARRVYAIEAEAVAGAARRMFVRNGVADRVRLVRGWSDAVTLPERCDVMIAELVGNDPLAEGIVPATRDAMARHLRPNARMIPESIGLHCLPLSLPADYRQSRTVSQDQVESWHDWYQVDFTALVDSWGDDAFVQFVDPYAVRTWSALGPEAPFAHVDLGAVASGPPNRHRGTVHIDQDGCLDGLLVYFTLHSCGRTFLSTAPTAVTADNHWVLPLRILPVPLRVRRGQRLNVEYWSDPSAATPRCRLTTVERRPIGEERQETQGRSRRPPP